MHLDRRKQTLLETIVVTYVQRAEPVGSHYLAAAQESLGVRSATIRNELAEMTDLGYLRQPHTSAGRIPSDLGYRYYVDHLMTWDRLSPGDARVIRSAQKISEGDLDQLLMQTCRVLSSLTRYTSMATPPTSEEPAVKHVHLVQIGTQRLLAVLVLDNGQVIHRFCETPRELLPAEVTELSNVLDDVLGGVTINRIPAGLLVEGMAAYEDVLRSLLGVIAEAAQGEDADLYLEGASHILEQPEFREANKVEPLVRFLEERKSAYETLHRMLEREDLTVSIGAENPHEAMRDVSLVAARYRAGGTAGWVGVLGPTRMQYAQVVPAVEYAARALTETLTRLGL
jgi:heat-inducible transcriptional repressor